MADYLPLDLSTLCNAGLEVLNEKPNTPIGDQLFRGLPFRVNDDPANCFIASDKISGSVTIPINSSATGLILAHRLLESDLMEGGPLGIPVADYVFRVEGRDEIRVPIRERFEIAHISLGGKPFRRAPGPRSSKDAALRGALVQHGPASDGSYGRLFQGILPLGVAEPPSGP